MYTSEPVQNKAEIKFILKPDVAYKSFCLNSPVTARCLSWVYRCPTSGCLALVTNFSGITLLVQAFQLKCVRKLTLFNIIQNKTKTTHDPVFRRLIKYSGKKVD